MPASDASTRVVGGRYRLDQSIGSGGMGTVWRGTDELLGRAVAVKEVRYPPEVGEKEQAELRERTMREARATARLSHPNVITTYDVVEDDGRPFIVMELLPSRSLSQVLREDGPLPPQRVAEIGLDILGALETSHRQGVVHRDVKPGNVLIADDGRAVLTDFGIATVAGDPALTSTGVVLGSPAYMSPERARGRRPGPQADLWGLGATLYAAVEGRPPFDSDNALSTLTSVISDPVPPPRVEGPLREVLLGLLAKDPDDRIPIDQARRLLERAARDQTPVVPPPAETVALDRGARTSAVPPVPAEPYAGQPSRRGPLVAALVVALLLIGGIAAFALAGSDDPGTAPKAAESPTKQEPSPTDTSPSPAESQSSTPPPAEPGVPAGFTRYEDPSGFALAIPQGWSAGPSESSPTAVDITDPAGGRFLRIDQTDEPRDDAKKTWQQLEKSVRERLPAYERIAIEDVDYRGWEAADWEFTWGPGTHVLNRGFVPNPSKGYAIYLSAPEEQWAESLQIFQVAADTFAPAGGWATGSEADEDD